MRRSRTAHWRDLDHCDVLTALAWIPRYEVASPFNPNILIASLIGIFFCVLLAAGVVFINAVDKELFH
jgi:hypothetical protein